MAGLTLQQLQQMGAQPAKQPVATGLTLQQLQAQGAKPVESKGIVRDITTDIVGSTIQRGTDIGQTLMQPFGAAIQYGVGKVKGEDINWSTAMDRAKTVSEKSVELNQDNQIGNNVDPKDTGILYDAMKQYPTKLNDLSTEKGRQRMLGEVVGTALDASMFTPVGAVARTGSILTKGAYQTGKQLAKEGAAYGAGYGFAEANIQNKDMGEVAYDTALNAGIGAVANPLIGGAFGLASKAISTVAPKYGKKAVQAEYPKALAESQDELDKVLNNITNPDVTPNTYFRENIANVRAKYPNLQQEVAVRTGKPITTEYNGSGYNFVTGTQAETLKTKATQASQEAAEVAKKYDQKTIIEKTLVEKQVDEILARTKVDDIEKVRKDAFKIIEKDYMGTQDGKNMIPSIADDRRKVAGLKTAKYNDDGVLVKGSDADSIVSEAYRTAVEVKTGDQEYRKKLLEAHDNFNLARLLEAINGKKAVTERGTIQKGLEKAGDAITSLGYFMPSNSLGVLQAVGKLLKNAATLGAAERNLVSQKLQQLIKKAVRGDYNFTEDERILLDFLKRVELAKEKGQPIDFNVKTLEVLSRNLNKDKMEKAIDYFNKQQGFEIEDTTVNVVEFYDRFKNADNTKEKQNIIKDLWDALLAENKSVQAATRKQAAPSGVLPKQDTFMDSPITPVKNADMEALRARQEAKAAADEEKFYTEQFTPTDTLGELEARGVEMKKEELIASLRDLAEEKHKAEMGLDFARQGIGSKENVLLNHTSRRELARVNRVTSNTVTDYASKSKVGKSVMRTLEDVAEGRDVEDVIEDIAGYYDLKKEAKSREEFLRDTKEKYNQTVKDLQALGLSDKAIKNVSQNFYGGAAGLRINEDGTVEYDPEAGAAGMALFSGSTALQAKYGDKLRTKAAEMLEKFVAGDIVKLTDKATGRSQERVITNIGKDGYTVMPPNGVGIPNRVEPEKWDIEFVKKGTVPERGPTFKELDEMERRGITSEEDARAFIEKSRSEAKVLREGQPEIGSREVFEDLVARDRFNIPQLEKVSFGGSDRDVYKLPGGRVLKISKNSRGLTQQASSADYYAERVGLIPETVEQGKNYIVKEFVGAPDENTKKMVKELADFGRAYDLPDRGNKVYDILTKYGYPGDEIMNYNVLWGDMKALRNWGTKDGKPMLLDEGTLNGNLVSHHQTGGRNLEDPEFRDIYTQSKKAKKDFGDKDSKTMYGMAGLPLAQAFNFPSSEVEVKATEEEKKKSNDLANIYVGNGKVDTAKIGDILHKLESNTGQADLRGYLPTRTAEIPDAQNKKTKFTYNVGYGKELGITPVAVAQLIKEGKYTQKTIQEKLNSRAGAKEVAATYFMRGLDPEEEYTVQELTDHYIDKYVTKASPHYNNQKLRVRVSKLFRDAQKTGENKVAISPK